MIHLTKKRFPAIFHSQKFHSISWNWLIKHYIAGPEVLNHGHAHVFDRCVPRSSFKTPLTYRWLTRFRSMLSMLSSVRPIRRKQTIWREFLFLRVLKNRLIRKWNLAASQLLWLCPLLKSWCLLLSFCLVWSMGSMESVQSPLHDFFHAGLSHW